MLVVIALGVEDFAHFLPIYFVTISYLLAADCIIVASVFCRIVC